MSDLQLLFVVLVALYLWECACWLPQGSVAVRPWLGDRWRLTFPGQLLGNPKGGFVFGHPVPPLGSLFTVHSSPLAFSPEAILLPKGSESHAAKLFRYEEIQEIEAKGKKISINGETILRAPSPTLAQHHARQVRELGGLPPARRESAIGAILRQSLDVKAIQERWRLFSQSAARVRVLDNVLFGYVFVGAPVLIWAVGLRMCWAWLLLGLLALTTTTAIFFNRVHKLFYPAAEEERFTHFLLVLLSPASTLRAHDVLSRPLLESFHPVAVAKAFCREADFRAYARTLVRSLRYPSPRVEGSEDATALKVQEFWCTARNQAIEEFLKRNNADPEELLGPPRPADPSCVAYCPRCQAQFTISIGTCADCGGLALIPFSTLPPAKAETRAKPL